MQKKGFTLLLTWVFFLMSVICCYADYYYNYFTYDEMVDLLMDLKAQAAAESTNVYSVQSIGDSYEGNPIYAVKFSDNPEIEEDAEPIIVIDAGIHGNEIIAQESCINYIQYLFEAYYSTSHPNHSEVVAMVNDLQIWIIPMINPDGRIKDTDGGDGDPAIHYTDDNFPIGWRVNTQPFPCPEEPSGFIQGANLNRTFSAHFNYHDDCSSGGGYNYGGTAPFQLHESRPLKKFIHNHMVSFVFHQHSPLQAFLTYAGPFGVYVSNEIVRIYNDGLINPAFALNNSYDPDRDLEPPVTPFLPPLNGQYQIWLWKEITDSRAPDYLSRRGIPAILFEFPTEKYGLPEESKFGQYDRNDGTDMMHMSSGEAVEWLLDKSVEIYNFLVKQTRYFYSPRYYTDMSRKPGGTVDDLALVGAKISEVGDGLPGCFFFDESDGRDLLEAGKKRITWNVQNNGTGTRMVDSEISICNLTDDPDCVSPTTAILSRVDISPETIETFTYEYAFEAEKDYSVTLTSGEDDCYDNDLKRYIFSTTVPKVQCPAALLSDYDAEKMKLLRNFRDTCLIKSARGNEYVKLFYKHSTELFSIVAQYPELRSQFKGILNRLYPVFSYSMGSKKVAVEPGILDDLEDMCDSVSQKASPEFKKTIKGFKKDLKEGTNKLTEQFENY